MRTKAISPLTQLGVAIEREYAYGLTYDPFQQKIDIFGQVKHYQTSTNEEGMSSRNYLGHLIQDKYVTLTASNEYAIDPATGLNVPVGTPGSVLEYDFYVNVALTTPVVIFALIEQLIDAGDQKGKFN